MGQAGSDVAKASKLDHMTFPIINELAGGLRYRLD